MARQVGLVASYLLFLIPPFCDARSVKILEINVKLVSPGGSAMICDQIVADALRQVAGSCLSICDTLVGFNSAFCNTDIDYDVVTLRGGIFGTDEDVIASVPCIRETLAADGCGTAAAEAIPSIGSLRYIGGVETSSPTFPSRPMPLSPTPAPLWRTAVPTRLLDDTTIYPTIKESVGTAKTPTATLSNLEGETAKNKLRYLVIIPLVAVVAVVFLCCFVGILAFWTCKMDKALPTQIQVGKRTSLGAGQDSTNSSESQSRPSRATKSQQSEIEERLYGVDVPSSRDQRSTILEKDELSSDGSSIREEKFDNASSEFYEGSPGEDETEVSCDESETGEITSEYDFSVSAAEFTRFTSDPESGHRSAAISVGSLSTNSFSHYINFDERDIENEEKRRHFLSWLQASKIIPPAAKHSIASSIVAQYGQLSHDKRPTEVLIRDDLVIEPADKIV